MMIGWESANYWTWEFLLNIKHLKAYPEVLRKFGWAPPTIVLYLGHAISFTEYFRDTPPPYCRLGGNKSILVFRELKKLYKHVGRTVLGHQTLVKQVKQGRLVAKESLAACQKLAKAKIPSLLDDLEKAPPKDPKTRYRFFGYLAAYLLSIYGHRTRVLTRMKVKEVKDALGDDQTGYLINVMEHKTVRRFGLAQLYLQPEEYGWFRKWLQLRKRAVPLNNLFFNTLGRGQARDMVRYFRRAWSEMGLPGDPSLLDVRTAVATYMSIANTWNSFARG
ncbi:uncharacterized protein LOC117820473 [Notolabrus celidotus]|uniref:uncharacterized protein LOC117820473 n=1 Tax=Notolabrus celidotus TaxID=1203425 RepID=UPI00148F6F41|nr:uncharacterized protein LOC117820473 [Notolabrus celidotus]